MGWMIGMQILSALEWSMSSSSSSTTNVDTATTVMTTRTLPEPFRMGPPITNHRWASLLLGIDVDKNTWTMPRIRCKTAHNSLVFPSNLDTIITSGAVGEEVSHTLPKGPMFYHHGWVLDMEWSRKKEKLLMKQWNNLGFTDSNLAYRGTQTSDILTMFVPLSNNSTQTASELVQVLLVCGSEDQEPQEGACKLHKDVQFSVQGEKTKVQLVQTDAVSYRGQTMCVEIPIPTTANLTRRSTAATTSELPNDHQQLRRLNHDYEYGITLEIQVINERITLDKGPCTVATVIWQDGPQ